MEVEGSLEQYFNLVKYIYKYIHNNPTCQRLIQAGFLSPTPTHAPNNNQIQISSSSENRLKANNALISTWALNMPQL